ncbi:hypothetical protein GGR56DRAFT_378628 [Xylariaceae sp. FL0804]|nr:hypothetical protein GGR56DRAFT_378628 [Xylariaceae sp. FL0804]
MFATRALRQAAAHSERKPLIQFLGKRSIPSNVDHTPRPHPQSPTGSLPEAFVATRGNSHADFQSYRSNMQLHGPLHNIGGVPAARLGPVEPPRGTAWDRNELPERFRRAPLTPAEIEAVETGGAALFG